MGAHFSTLAVYTARLTLGAPKRGAPETTQVLLQRQRSSARGEQRWHLFAVHSGGLAGKRMNEKLDYAD